MKTVIDIKTFNLINVPEQWIQCSVCGVYHSPAEYRKPDQDYQSRTNCTSCYEMPYEAFKSLARITAETMKTPQYKATQKELKTRIACKKNSISVEDMIASLQLLPPNSRLIVTQEGYYADGEFADIFDPSLEKTIGDVGYYSIGHSSQNY